MKARIIQIGNSQGIRIPKVLLEEAAISGDVDLVPVEDGILIRNISKPRSDWDSAFANSSESDEDAELHERSAGDFESKEWQW